MSRLFLQKGSVKYFYFYHIIILGYNENYFHWKTFWDIFQNLWASEPHRGKYICSEEEECDYVANFVVYNTTNFQGLVWHLISMWTN